MAIHTLIRDLNDLLYTQLDARATVSSSGEIPLHIYLDVSGGCGPVDRYEDQLMAIMNLLRSHKAQGLFVSLFSEKVYSTLWLGLHNNNETLWDQLLNVHYISRETDYLPVWQDMFASSWPERYIALMLTDFGWGPSANTPPYTYPGNLYYAPAPNHEKYGNVYFPSDLKDFMESMEPIQPDIKDYILGVEFSDGEHEPETSNKPATKGPMTTGNLINILNKYPHNLPVTVSTSYDSYTTYTNEFAVTITTDNNGTPDGIVLDGDES